MVDVTKEKLSIFNNSKWAHDIITNQGDSNIRIEEELPEDFVTACLFLGNKLIEIAKSRIKKDSEEKELWQCLIEYIYSSHPQKKNVVTKLAM